MANAANATATAPAEAPADTPAAEGFGLTAPADTAALAALIADPATAAALRALLAPGAPASAPVRVYADTAVIDYVAPNPKKPGSATHGRYAVAYTVGQTLGDAKKRGATAADIRWDLAHGHIRLRA